MREYDLIAEWYASERTDTTTGGGVPDAVAMAASLSRGSRILDIGCGNGVPLTRALLHAGVEFHYCSFSKDAYRRVLAEHGLTFVSHEIDAGQNGYYLARKAG